MGQTNVMSTSEAERLERLREAYASERCACRSAKKRRQAFCNACTRCLAAIRSDRYLLDGSLSASVTADAYEVCLRFLKDEGYVAEGVKL